jgi:ribosomal protein S18 acetylase RimI-like enzyme
VAGNLRSFDERDRDAVAALSRHALARLEEQVGVPLWATRAELDASLEHWEGSPSDSLRVIEEGGEVAAFGGVQVGGVLAVVGPLVAPRFRGQKMGSQLLEASIDLARAARGEWLIAAVGPRNAGGRLLLERHGFRSRGGVDAVYRLLPADHRPAGPAPPGVEVRAGAGGDLDRIWSLYRQSFPIGRRSEDVWRRWLDEREVLVAERDGETVAFVHIEPVAGWITHVGVAEEARGLGVGGYLFSSAVEDWWRQRPDSELRLSVKPDNTPAIRVYRRLGFAPWLVLQSFELELGG